MPTPVEIAFKDEVCAVGAVGNVLISITRSRQDVTRLRQLRKAIDVHFKKWPGGVATISVLEPKSYSGLITSEEREEITRMARDYSARGVALVIEGSGFRPAAVRVMLAGIYLVARVTYPRKIFERMPEAATWLTTNASAGHPGAVDAPTLQAAIEQLRQAIGT